MKTPYQSSLELAASQLERRRVRLILQEFGLEAWNPQIRDAEYALTGEKQLSFAAFDCVFPGFPICLESQALYHLGQHTTCTQTAMFRDFRRYLPYQKFQALQETLQARAFGRPIGIVYSWPGIKNGLVLHDGDFPSEGFKQTFTDGPVRITVERFWPMVRTLAASDISVKMLQSSPVFSAESPPRSAPRLNQVVMRSKTLHEAQMLTFLVGVLFEAPPDLARRHIRRYWGERWVVATQEELAERIGVSVRTIQRTIGSLAARNLVEVRRTERGTNCIRLCQEAFDEETE